MKKGMFYLLPLLAITQIGASNATSQVERSSLTTVKTPVVAVASSSTDSLQVMKTLPRPLSGRNKLARDKLLPNVPRAGRNVRRIAHGKQLLKRR